VDPFLDARPTLEHSLAMKLKSRHLLVTGSATGIGEAIARRCVAEGARVVIHGQASDLAQGKKIARELDTVMLVGDLADPAIPAQLIDQSVAALGQLDGLVNNAAWVVRGQIGAASPELFDRCLAVNCRAPLFLIQAALPHLARFQGSVVNIGSVNAYCGEENLLPYSISKGALMTLTRNLGDTLMRQHHVRVNQINPGWVLTENERLAKQAEGMADDWPAHLPPMFAPSGRIFAPAEIAEAAVYFLSTAAGPISGQVLDIEQHPFIGRNPPKC
jgi:NAD(P)-dependent dehydrogenase (short-subunit alcohol dehydrogenase family)